VSLELTIIQDVLEGGEGISSPMLSVTGLSLKTRTRLGQDESISSKTPFSQRHSVLSAQFLVVAAPYHSMYMNEAPEKFFREDLGAEELWQAEDLQMPVFHTESGLFQRPICACSLLIIALIVT
jgi:fatty acid synthase subunit alpha